VTTQAPPNSEQTILTRILEEAWSFSQAEKTFLAVFDLDSTLFDLTLRVSAIVDEFAEAAINIARFPRECAELKRIEILTSDWGLEAPLKRIGLSTHDAFFKALNDYWAEYFFSNEYLAHDEPLPGAVEYVQELHLSGANIMYLSGRDLPRMGPGTEASLRDHHFPLLPGTAEIILKPRSDLDDAYFKLDVIKEALNRYERIWLFENEPVNLNLIGRQCPEVGLVFIESTHSGREQLQRTLSSIRHFDADLSEFRSLKKATHKI